MAIKIFRGNRGEGKTKWLADRIKERAEAGDKSYYVGDRSSFNSLKRVYESIYNELCPVEYDDKAHLTPYDSFFTDELFDNMMIATEYKSYIIDYDCDWYITMSKEDFMN